MNKDIFKIVLLSGVVVISACGGGGSDSSGGAGGGDTTGGGTTGGATDTNSTDTSSTASMTFNISGAVALLANSDVVEAVTSSSMVRGASSEKPLFTYRVVNNSSSSIRATTDGTTATSDSSSTTDSSTGSGSTNLLSIDEDGNASLAIDSNVPIKILYTIAAPDGDSVYVALDNGWYGSSDGNDYTRYIAQNNCALYRVVIADNSFDCVEEGLYVQNMDDNYRKAISGNQKPIQFDSDGNLYFTATTFTVSGDAWCIQFDENGNCTEEETNYWIDGSSWQPRIYMRDVETGAVAAITQDNESIDFFLVLPSGELVFQSTNETTWQNELSILQGSQKIDLSGGTWGVDFFTVDSGNTVIFGQGDYAGSGDNGLRFARPRTEGGVEKASLNTSLFGADSRTSGWGNPKPRRIIPGDDGRLYGVFEGGRDSYDTSGTYTGWTQILTVYQMLPYDGVPKIELELGNDVDWWSWMGDTPFQISRGYLYYTETIDVEFLGTADVIRMMNLSTRETTTLLEPSGSDDPRYQIYNWRLNGSVMYFSGLNKNGNIVVTGELDTVAVRDGADALTVNSTASALGATSSVQDIEVLLPQEPEVDTGSAPVVLEVHQDMDNLYSMSVDFTKYMNKELVAQNLGITSGVSTEGPASDGVVTYLPVWLFKTLHLIPDLDGLGGSDTTAMSPGTQYTMSFGTGIRDAYGWDLAVTADSAITLRPDNGWYVGSLSDSVNAAVAATDVLRYAGASTLGDLETFNLGTIPSNVRFEFSGKNMGWEGPQFIVWDENGAITDVWTKTIMRLRMGNWSDLEYRDSSNSGMWDNAETPEMFNGTFKRYRIDLYGSNLVISVSDDGTAFTEVAALSQTDLGSRSSTYSLLLRVRDGLQLDNLEISTLDSSGAMTTVGDIYSEDFNGDTAVPASFATDVSDSLGLDNW